MTTPIVIPADHETEQDMLGTILNYPKTYHLARAVVTPTFWHDPRHAAIWQAMQALGDAHKPIDLSTVMEQVRDTGAKDRIGGYGYLNEVSNHGVTSQLMGHYIERLQAVETMRRIIDLGAYMLQEGQACRPHHAGRLIAGIMDQCVRLSRPSAGAGMVHVDADLAEIERAFASGASLAGVVPTGFATLDRMTNGGLAPARVTVVGAEAGSGKSTLANTIATNAALAGRKVAVFSLEDTRQDWHRRTLSRLSEVPYAAFQDAEQRTAEMVQRVRRAREVLGKCRLWAFDATELTSGQAVALALAHRAEHGLDLVVVDHLIEFADKADSNHVRITAAIRNMRALAQQANIPVLVLAQLNREGKLRESGSIEEVARAVWRLETDAPASEDRSADHEQEVHRRLRIVKSNYGRKGTVNLWSNFEQFYMREWGFADGEWTWEARKPTPKPGDSKYRSWANHD